VRARGDDDQKCHRREAVADPLGDATGCEA
jgi:hypothetical protein